mmetsp:Transcript_10635/g.29411  ORF Transcript_10635/g.29411 Transcript_10635/m.29411 type:complete len:216 (+) Transcript_10635:268-915(+)
MSPRVFFSGTGCRPTPAIPRASPSSTDDRTIWRTVSRRRPPTRRNLSTAPTFRSSTAGRGPRSTPSSRSPTRWSTLRSCCTALISRRGSSTRSQTRSSRMPLASSIQTSRWSRRRRPDHFADSRAAMASTPIRRRARAISGAARSIAGFSSARSVRRTIPRRNGASFRPATAEAEAVSVSLLSSLLLPSIDSTYVPTTIHETNKFHSMFYMYSHP